MKIIIPKCKNSGETLYFTAFILYVFCAFYNTTTFKAHYDISGAFNGVRLLALVLIGVKSLYFDRYSKKNFLFLLIFTAIGMLSILQSERSAIFDYLVLMIGARNISPQKIIRMHFMIVAPFLVITFICSNIGLIIDYTVVRKHSTQLRHSFGIVYPTDFAAHVFFIVLTALYLKRKRIGTVDLLVITGIALFIRRFCDARLSTMTIILSPILFLLMQKLPKVFESKAFARVVGACGFLFVAAVTVLSVRYSVTDSFIVNIDENLFNGRLYVVKNVIDTYGFSLFGKEIQMQGDGFKTYVYDSNIGTTYIDSAYMQIMLLYGVVLLCVLLVGIYLFSLRAWEMGDKKMVICILIVLLSCIHNQYLIFVAYNPFMLTLGYYFFGLGEEKTRKRKRIRTKQVSTKLSTAKC